ncbi:MAG TPA: hypothetical protein VFA59_22090 [Vicinamibacterales bacterium]|nr:hypothetical protein [Vicinamibacterales bacterium]
MSKLNGDKARFEINRKRKMLHRQRIKALTLGLKTRRAETPSSASVRMSDEGAPLRSGD